MEKNKRIIELLLALVFVGLLLFASVIIIKESERETQQPLVSQNIQISPSYVINSYIIYNNYEMNYTILNPVKSAQTVNLRERDHYNYERENIDYYNHEEERVNSPDYREYSGQERRKEFLGNYVQEFYVYVLNKERTGRYFTVTFELEDKNGYEFSESITLYLKSGEKEKFVYRDIQFERNEIVDWGYEVTPEDY